MKVFVIAGKAGCGKDLVGEYLKSKYDAIGQNACILHITTPLYEYARNYFSWNGDMKNKPREFLQEMGVEIIQKKLGKKYFLIDRLCEDIDILKNYFDVFIITDGRLVSEFDELNSRFNNIKFIHVIRKNYDNDLSDKAKKHITETDLDNYNDYNFIFYNSSLEKLYEQVDNMLNELEGGN